MENKFEDSSCLGFMLFEIIIFSIILGFYFHSWFIFIGSIIILFIILQHEITMFLFNFIVSIGYGWCGYKILVFFNIDIGYLFSIIVFVISFLIHSVAMTQLHKD